jgi:hypothetical protein
MYIMVPQHISITRFIYPSHQSLCLYVYASLIARQRLGKNFTVATNTHAIIEGLLDALLSMWSVSYQQKVAGNFFPELLLFN